MKRPNQELFRLLRFAIHYPGWHLFQGDARKHIKRGAELGFFDVNYASKEFRLTQSMTTAGRALVSSPSTNG
jgi:hypothetical protein